MFCPNCGRKIEGAARFCPDCGKKLPGQVISGQSYQAQQEQQKYNRQTQDRQQQSYDKDSLSGSPESRKQKTDRAPSTATGSMMLTVTRVAAVVFAVPCVVQAVLKLIALIGSIVTIFSSPLRGIFALAVSILILIGCVIMALGLLLMAFRINHKEDGIEPFLLTVALGGVVRVVLLMVSAVISMIGRSAVKYYDGISFVDVFWVFLYIVAVTGILFGLCFAAGLHPFDSVTKESLVEEIRSLPDFLSAELESFLSRFDKGEETVQEQVQSDGTVKRIVVMDEKRGLFKYVLLSIVTCFIYALYEYHTIARDVNLACEEDGEHTAGLVKLILLTLVTCGIYNLVWFYKLLNRVEGASHRYGFEIKTVGNMDLGICFIVLYFAGVFTSWLCGIGLIVMLYGYYLIFRNLNAMAANYNLRMGAPEAASGGEA